MSKIEKLLRETKNPILVAIVTSMVHERASKFIENHDEYIIAVRGKGNTPIVSPELEHSTAIEILEGLS